MGIPEGWELRPIGDFLTESRIPGTDGARAKKLSVKLYGNGVVPKQENRPGSKSTKYYIRRAGQFIYSKLDFLNGAFGIIPEELDGYESTLDIPAFDISDEINPQWLLSYVSREQFYSAQLGLAKGGRKARRVPPREFLRIKIPVPPRREQDRITEILGSVDDAILATLAVIEQTRKVKQGVLEELLTHGIGHTRYKQTEIGEVPEGWEVVSLHEVLRDVVPGRSPSASNDPAGPSEFGVLKVSAVGFGEFYSHENKALPNDYPVEDRFRVRGGDLLITRANTKELVGAACIVPEGEYNLMLSDKTLRLDLVPDRITPDYACSVLLSGRVRTFLQENASGTSGSMKNISQALIRSN